jgi:hypothetical protein
MGKEYFEFLEEEYMGLTSQVQRGLKQQQQQQEQQDKATAAQQQPDGTNQHVSSSSIDQHHVRIDLPLLFTRCQAIYQQMQVESRKNPEFKERLTLYSIQLSALLEHYQSSLFPPPPLPAATAAVVVPRTTNASAKGPDAVSAVAPPTKAAAPSTTAALRQELTFTFTINEEDDYDTSLL